MKWGMLLIWFLGLAYASDVINNPESFYHLTPVESSQLNHKVTVNWKFHSLKEFTLFLQKNYAISSKIVTNAANTVSQADIYLSNGTVEQLITQVSQKLGYKWRDVNGVIMFHALNPVLDKNVDISEQIAWQLSPSDRTLRNAFTRWCKMANWQLVWNARADYPISTSWLINGSFESAVNEVLKASQETEMPLVAIMHDSNHVLEVTAASRLIP